MWQQIIAALLVIAAALYAARALGPRSWRRKRARAAGPKAAGAGSCGCGKDSGCH